MPQDRQIRDSMFKLVYSQPKYAGDLVCQLTGGVVSPSLDEVKSVTVKRELTAGIENDLALQVGDTTIILVEAQSYELKDLQLRMLFYVAEVLRVHYWDRRKFGRTEDRLPAVHLYVLYDTNNCRVPAPVRLHLSDIMHDDGVPSSISLDVDVVTPGDGKVSDEYFEFCNIVARARKAAKSATTQDEFTELFRKTLLSGCLQHSIYVDIVEQHINEFEEVLSSMTREEYRAKFEREEGREEARAQLAITALEGLLKVGVNQKDCGQILKAQGFTDQEIKYAMGEFHSTKTPNGSGTVNKLNLEEK